MATKEHLAYIPLACRELNRFSIPGIGTFMREMQPARFDPQTQTLHPPHEIVKLISGKYSHTPEFRTFIQQKQGLTFTQAQDLVEEIGENLAAELKRAFRIEIPSFGRLTRNPDGTYALEVDAVDPTLQSFGLSPVAYPEPKATAPKTKRNETPAEVKSAAPQAAAPNRQWNYVALVGLLLLLGLLTKLLYDYREELFGVNTHTPHIQTLPAETDTTGEGQNFTNVKIYIDSLKTDSLTKDPNPKNR